MSLTALIHQKLPEIRFVEWFRDPRFSISYPKAPLALMTRYQFERIGIDFIRCHFKEYEDFRLSEKHASKIFETAEDKKILKKHVPVSIYRHHETGNLIIMPCRFRQYNLGGIVPLDKDLFPHADIPFDCLDDEFVRAFDTVAAEAG